MSQSVCEYLADLLDESDSLWLRLWLWDMVMAMALDLAMAMAILMAMATALAMAIKHDLFTSTSLFLTISVTE